MRWFIFRQKKREDKRKKRSVLSVIFLQKHKNCIRDFCVISTYSYVSPMDIVICPTFFPLHYYTPTFSKNKEKHAKKDSYKWNPYKWGDLTQLPIYFRPFIAVKSPHQMAGQESSEIAIHPLLHRSIQRIQRHHKEHDDLQADLRPHPRLLSPRLRRMR